MKTNEILEVLKNNGINAEIEGVEYVTETNTVAWRYVVNAKISDPRSGFVTVHSFDCRQEHTPESVISIAVAMKKEIKTKAAARRNADRAYSQNSR